MLLKRACTGFCTESVWGDEADGARISHKDVNKFPLVVCDVLELDGVKQLPAEVTVGVNCWWFHSDMTAVYCTNCTAESW